MKSKKSLIIAPALAALFVAAAGSVSGTVAWFASVSQFQTNISEFAVTQLDGSLSCEMTAGIGTAKNNETGAIYVPYKTDTELASIDDDFENHRLTHGSFYETNKKVYMKGESGFREMATVGTSSEPAFLAGSYVEVKNTHDVTQKVYTAVTWTMAFTYEFKANTDRINLYFDNSASGSAITPTTIGDTKTLKTHKGFRIAFVGDTTGNATAATRVWADQQVTAKCHRVTGTAPAIATEDPVTGAYSGVTASSNPALYSDLTLISSENAGARIAEGAAESATKGAHRRYYLGTFTPSTATTLTYTCVAWFEGTDENIVSAAEMQSVAASMKFYTRHQVTEEPEGDPAAEANS